MFIVYIVYVFVLYISKHILCYIHVFNLTTNDDDDNLEM